MVRKVINFGAGPSKIPEPVMQKAAAEFLNFEDSGISVLETSHRTGNFDKCIRGAANSLRQLMQIPDNFEVLFMHGGGTGQFAGVPLNIKGDKTSADYIVTGTWSAKAHAEGSKFLQANKVFDTKKVYTTVPPESEWKRDPNAAFLYYCANETVHGIEFHKAPSTLPGVPLVADISSNFLSRPFDFTDHGVVFGGAQKNLGASGVTIVIVRKDLIDHVSPICPTILSYKDLIGQDGISNTPTTFSIYITNLVLEWIKDQGGAQELYEINKAKAGMIYSLIDESSGFYSCPVDAEYRSNMNLPFRIGGGNEQLEVEFLKGAQEKGMIQLKGHRAWGGMGMMGGYGGPMGMGGGYGMHPYGMGGGPTIIRKTVVIHRGGWKA